MTKSTVAPGFDAEGALQRVREKRELSKRRRWRPSKVARYRAELVAMRKAGASYNDLAVWLHMQHRLRVSATTIMRYLASLPGEHSHEG
ncbi:hypothetical protein [Roseibium sp. RKSG952]|uniref:hypothetical protein n=1 Tax=Roseibium sp. RKSG952 TaxID=2529384 RepID=UPI0012BD5881|nr:hypothetical protein [Roseibium sp. RKSG952]MTH95373.1 hypothetical protein [Roseibium sp. RKSG952]